MVSGLLTALLLAAPLPVAAETGPDAPPLVTRVEVRSDAALDRPREIRALIAIEPGEPLEERRVRRTLRNLHLAGVASEAEIYTRPEGEGVVAVLVIRAQLQVERIRLEGQLGLRASELRRSILQREGQPLVEDRLLRTIHQLNDLYRRHGYFEASVRLAVDVDEERRQAVVTYFLDSGPRASIGEVSFEGDLGPFEPRQLVDRLRARPDTTYRAERVREDAERLQAWLIGQRYRMAVVEPSEERFDAERNRVDLAYRLEVGPEVIIDVSGADIRQLRRRNLLPFLGEAGYDEALVLQSMRRIEQDFQERGHYLVEVERREARTEDQLFVTLMVDTGPTLALEEIRFTGNQAVSDTRLLELMATRPRRFLAPGSGRLVDQELRADLANIRSFYALRGYGDVRVGPEEVEIRNERIFVTIPIVEGRERRVVDVRFEGLETLDEGRVRATMPLKAGGPFHPLLLDNSLEAVRVLYEERGFPYAQVSADLDWNEPQSLVDVTFQVFEGAQVVVDRVIVRGNTRTRSGVVSRFAGLEQGEPVSHRRLLEVQRDLYQLGVFSRVTVEPAPTVVGVTDRDILVRVEEGTPRRLTYGLGFGSEDGVAATAGYSHANLWGRAYAGQLDLRASRRDRRARLLLNQPYVGAYPISMTYSLFRFEERRRSFDVERWGTQVEAARLVGEDLRLSLIYNYRIVQLQNVEVDLSEIERDLRRIQLSSISPRLLYDRRDDPLTPTRGWSSNAQLTYAFPLFRAEEQFLKLFLQQTQYLDLGRAGVVAGSFRIGALEPLTERVADAEEFPGFEDLPTRHVAIFERFFAGGRTTHRAYSRDSLGIRGQSLLEPDPEGRPGAFAPVGGTGLLLVNLDYRFPIMGPFGGTVFVDVGNVWADWRNMSLEDLKPGVGVGVRYLSPIGPLRLEVGWKLDREPGERPTEWFLSFGYPF